MDYYVKRVTLIDIDGSTEGLLCYIINEGTPVFKEVPLDKRINMLEYQALVFALKDSRIVRNSNLHIRTDSEYVIKGMTGVNKVRALHIRPQHRIAKGIIRINFLSDEYEHVTSAKSRAGDAIKKRLASMKIARAPVPHKDGSIWEEGRVG